MAVLLSQSPLLQEVVLDQGCTAPVQELSHVGRRGPVEVIPENFEQLLADVASVEPGGGFGLGMWDLSGLVVWCSGLQAKREGVQG